jgi:hypothetical protein
MRHSHSLNPITQQRPPLEAIEFKVKPRSLNTIETRNIEKGRRNQPINIILGYWRGNFSDAKEALDLYING